MTSLRVSVLPVFRIAILLPLVILAAQSSTVVHANQANALPTSPKQAAAQDTDLPALSPPPAHFALPVAYTSAGFYAVSVAADDLNGDGAIDLVEANSCEKGDGSCGNSELSVFLGNKNGTFQAAVSYISGGIAASSVAVGDVNGDGHPDLVIANECVSSSNCNNGIVSVLLGNGDGTFQSAVSYNAGYVPVAVATADLNGDGHLDLIVANHYQCNNCKSGGVSILLGNGDGTFQSPVSYNSGGVAATALAVRDLNGDGHLDVVVTNQYQCQNCGNGQVSVLLGKGDGTLKTPVSYSSGGYAALSVAVGDVNGDSKPDLIVTNLCAKVSSCTNGIVAVLLGNGDGTFRSNGTYSSGAYGANSVAIADVNGDGAPDLIVDNTCKANTNCSLGGMAVLLGNGDGTFQSAVAHSSGGEDANSVVIADLKGDGRPDVITANNCASNTNCSGSVAVLLNTTSDKTTTRITASPNPSGINQAVTFTATVSSALAIPDGQVVTFYLGKTNLGTGLTSGGQTTLTTSFSKAGSYTVKASYEGDAYHKASSGTVQQVVNP